MHAGLLVLCNRSLVWLGKGTAGLPCCPARTPKRCTPTPHSTCSNVHVAIVTAAGYPGAPERFEQRVEGLLAAFRQLNLPQHITDRWGRRRGGGPGVAAGCSGGGGILRILGSSGLPIPTAWLPASPAGSTSWEESATTCCGWRGPASGWSLCPTRSGRAPSCRCADAAVQMGSRCLVLCERPATACTHGALHVMTSTAAAGFHSNPANRPLPPPAVVDGGAVPAAAGRRGAAAAGGRAPAAPARAGGRCRRRVLPGSMERRLRPAGPRPAGCAACSRHAVPAAMGRARPCMSPPPLSPRTPTCPPLAASLLGPAGDPQRAGGWGGAHGRHHLRGAGGAGNHGAGAVGGQW